MSGIVNSTGAKSGIIGTTVGSPSLNTNTARNAGLVVKKASAASVDIDADYLTVYDTNNVGVILNSINLTVNMGGASGANGLDTGSEAGSTWYNFWVIYDGTITASLLSLSATAPTMPSGYTYKKYIGAVYNGGGSDFENFHQMGNLANRNSTNIGNIALTTPQTMDLSTKVPPAATFVNGRMYASRAGDYSSGYVYLAVDTDKLGELSLRYRDGHAGQDRNIWCPYYGVRLETAQTAYMWVNNTAVTGTLYVSGWGFDDIV